MTAPVWTVWKTPERSARIAEAAQNLGTGGLTSTLDALLEFHALQNKFVNPGYIWRGNVAEALRGAVAEVRRAYAGSDDAMAAVAAIESAMLAVLALPSPNSAPSQDNNSVCSRTHAEHTQEE